MTVTMLDTCTALVIVDVQEGIAAMLGRHALEYPVAQAHRLATEFGSRRLPVILVKVAYSYDNGDRPANRVDVEPFTIEPVANFTEIMPELGVQPADIVIEKRQVGAFFGTDLDLQLRRRGCTGIVLAGVATSLGVESTARAAYDYGYNVTCAADAMVDFDPAAHRHSLNVTLPWFSEVGTSDAVIATLDGR